MCGLIAALSLVPWPGKHFAVLTLLTNLLKAIKNVSASILSSRPRCMQRVVKHLKSMPHLFSVRQPTFTMKDPKQSMPVDQNGGLDKRRRAGGRSAISDSLDTGVDVDE